jgi:hypothetical protein
MGKFRTIPALFLLCSWTLAAEAKGGAHNADSIVVELGESAPSLNFFRAKKDGGGVVLKVNAEGFFKGDEKLCGWNAPKYSPPDKRKMQLVACPSGLPMRSWPGELKIAITNLSSAAYAQVEYAGETLYLNLGRLPKQSWHSEVNAQKGADLKENKLSRLAQDPSLETFKQQAKACYATNKAVDCLARFIADKIFFPPAASASSGDSMVNAEKFVSYLWAAHGKTCDNETCAMWDELARCFDAPAKVEFNAIRLVGPDYFCELQKGADGWQISLFGKNASASGGS